ncbi:type III-A CRISPR-associated protein Csm2 [Nitratiruptor sp. YY09-18]|uniref:type III-A CRISPR-associated protein Csm2 n=1 Tax=Nitratiruptor sp. YY09-18 TaxID=2724901 RepID=UPI001915661F|nr:type III-A CRISPR-associated protein Csm2 [Nitratiruptor sp. YY09-18]BCD68480.1 CRISPR-associated protein Csm2 [Nitratiruptor sp. YY09-18]
MIVLNLKEDKELLNETAKEWAEKIKRTKKTQVRNFYDKVLELEEKIKKEDFDDVLPFIKMLNSKVAYAVNRRVASREFQEMIESCIKQIDTKEKFNTFKLFFEAVIGFYKGE